MNPDSDMAVEVRRRALVDQIDDLEKRIADGRDGPHVTKRPADTRIELGALSSLPDHKLTT